MPTRIASSTPAAPVSPPAATAAPKKLVAQQAPAAAGWKPTSGKTTVEQRRLLESTLNNAITLPAGTSFLVRLGHVRSVLGTLGTDGKRVLTEQLAAKLPARSAEERGRILSLATALGAKTPALTERLMNDAIRSGDAQLALELVHDGATLTKSQKLELAPHIMSDEVLISADATKNLTRAAVSVLADQPKALERFAKSISSPAVLFTEVLANRDQSGARALKPLVGLLSPKEARGLLKMHPRSELSSELRARANS